MKTSETQPLLPLSEAQLSPAAKHAPNHGSIADIADNAANTSLSHKSTSDNAGFAFVSFSAFCFGICLTILRYLSVHHYLQSIQITFFITLSLTVLSSIYLAVGMCNRTIPSTISKSALLWLILRGSGGALCMVFLVLSLRYIPAGDADTIVFISPIITIFLSVPILGERISIVHTIAAFLALVGSIVVASPSPIEDVNQVVTFQRVIGCALAFAAALANSIVMIAVRKVVTCTHFMFSIWFLGVFGLIITIPLGGPISLTTLTHDSFLFALCLTAASLVFVGQVAYNYGFRFCPASTGSVIRNLEIPTAYVLSVLVLHDQVSVARLFGAVLVVAASVMIPFANVCTPTSSRTY